MNLQHIVISLGQRALTFLLLALMIGVISGCGSDSTVDSGDVGIDVGDVGPGEVATCDVGEELEFEGAPASPGDACGECGDGLLVCDEEGALECVGAGSTNACGGCRPLMGEPDEACGPCGDGVRTCQDDGTLACEGATDANICGGCQSLDGIPGSGCDLDGGDTGVLRCATTEELRCVGAGENACGGSSELEMTPGMPCGACHRGTVVCDGSDSVTCEDEDKGLNACGGCTPLAGEPDEACGECSGEWYCATDDVSMCDDSDLNACGGCADLGDAMPGEECDGDSVWICDGPNDMICPDEATNACGGTQSLDTRPGDVCGDCGDGRTICTSQNSTGCLGASQANECDGCGLLPAPVGERCGAGATWECTDDGAMRCETTTELNACGGTQPLDDSLGQPCGPCDLNITLCDGSDAVTCSGETACPEFLDTVVDVSDISEEAATFHGAIDQLPPAEITDHGFCWSEDANPAGDDANCESLGSPTEAGPFSMSVEDLTAGTHYYVQAFATIADNQEASGEASFWTVSPAPEVSASTDLHDRVTLSWSETDGADHYLVYRDGEEIADVDGHAFDDLDADAGLAPDAPEILSVSEDLTEGIELTWDEASAAPGTEHDYQVMAVNADDRESQPGEATGQRAGAEIDAYELCIGEVCDDDDWAELDTSDGLVYLDTSAPTGELSSGTAETSGGQFEGFVRLTASGWEIEEPAPQHYRIRAINDAGVGEATDANDGQGQRATGPILYAWYGSTLEQTGGPTLLMSAPDGFSLLVGPSEEAHTYDDEDAPSDGADRQYFLSVSADGATSTEYPGVDNPLTGFVNTGADVITLSAHSVGVNSATLRGRIETIGAPPAVEAGICWNRSEPAEEGNCAAADPMAEEGEEFEVETITLGSGRQYYFRAYLEDEDGHRNYANHRSFITKPSAPANVQTTSEVDHVTLDWDAVRGAEEYRILRDGDEIATVSDPTFDDDGATAGSLSAPQLSVDDGIDAIELNWNSDGLTTDGSAHTYQVIAVNAAGKDSSPSSSVDGNRLGSPIEEYKVLRDDSAIATVSATEYSDNETTPGSVLAPQLSVDDGVDAIDLSWNSDGLTSDGTTHHFEVIAVNGYGEESAPSNRESGKRLASPVEEYKVLRDGSPIATVSSPEYSDNSTTPGSVLAPQLTVDNGVDAIELSWSPDGLTSDGSTHSFTVMAVNENGDESDASNAMSGKRLASPIDDYEVSIDGGDWDSVNWQTENNSITWSDDDALEGSFAAGDLITISQATHVDHVELESQPATSSPGNSRNYRVRAINELDESGPASEQESGQRIVGDFSYQWQSAEDGGTFQDLGIDCDDELACNDDSASSDGSSRNYRLKVTADGVTGADYSEEHTGYVAVLLLHFHREPPTEVDIGESFDVEVQLVNQHIEAMTDDSMNDEITDIDVDIELNKNDFADGVETTSNPNSDGLAAFSLTINDADDGYVLTAKSAASVLDETSRTFELILVPFAENSWITGESDAAADGSEEAQISIGLFGPNDEPVAGITPEFEASGDGNNVPGSCSVSGSDGLSSCTLTSDEPGEKTLQLTEPVQVSGDSVGFFATLNCNENGSPFGAGSGSRYDPYQICTPEHLNTVNSHRNRSFVVTEPIDMSDISDFNRIGSPFGGLFTGRFNGNGQPISNLTLDSDNNHQGMFRYTGSFSVIENVVLTDVDITQDGQFGGALVGINEGEIRNSSVSGTVTATLSDTGGLVGRNLGTIRNSSSTADVEGSTEGASGQQQNTGGLVGNNNGGDVIASWASGEVIGRQRVGGLVGRGSWNSTNDTNSTIRDSYAINSSVEGSFDVGGLLGEDHGNGTVRNSYSTSPVDSWNASGRGGLIGDWGGTVANSYWDVQTSGESESFGGTGLDTDDFDDQSLFEDAGWNFSDTWKMGTTPSPDGETRPILQWQ